MHRKYANSEEYFAEMRGLIDAWCERRCIHLLGTLLPAYLGFNGLTDGWGELLVALKTLHFLRDPLPQTEQDIIRRLLWTTQDVIERDPAAFESRP